MVLKKRVRALSEFNFKTAQEDKSFIEGEVDVVTFKHQAEFETFVRLGFFVEAAEGDTSSVDIPIIISDEAYEELQLSGNLDQLEEKDIALTDVEIVIEEQLEEKDIIEEDLSEDVKEQTDRKNTHTPSRSSQRVSGLGWKK